MYFVNPAILPDQRFVKKKARCGNNGTSVLDLISVVIFDLPDESGQGCKIEIEIITKQNLDFFFCNASLQQQGFGRRSLLRFFHSFVLWATPSCVWKIDAR